MNEPLRQRQADGGAPGTGDEGFHDGLSTHANSARDQLAAADALIDNILSADAAERYLGSIRQHGGQ